MPVWARDNRPSPENRPVMVFTAWGRGSAPESEGRSSLTGSLPSPEGATIETSGVTDPGGNGLNKSTKRAEPLERPAQGKAKLGKTEGFFALGAWSARLEIARLLATGVPADEIVAEIHSGQEGEDPLVACSPFVPCRKGHYWSRKGPCGEGSTLMGSGISHAVPLLWKEGGGETCVHSPGGEHPSG